MSSRTVNSFEVVGKEAQFALQKLAKDHSESITCLDVIIEKLGIKGNASTLVTTSGHVVGFRLETAISVPSLIYNEDLKASIPNMGHPDGVSLRKELASLKLPNNESVTKAFGGKPFIGGDGEVHFMSLKLLDGKAILGVPEGMEATLPDGLNPIQHIYVR